MIKGGCQCGKVRFEYAGDIDDMAMCHCSQCRKAQGGAFATNAPVDASLLSFSGEEHLVSYESSPGKARVFCGTCGSPMYSQLNSLPNIKRLRLGTVDTPIQFKNKYHIYAASRADWHEITDNYVQYEKKKE